MKNTITIFFLLLSISAFGQKEKRDTCTCTPPKWEIFYPGGWNGDKIIIRRYGKPDSVITKRKNYRL